ncbi:MAG TPA: MarR family transcriptional regulator [Vicinamibacteria bacterium]
MKRLAPRVRRRAHAGDQALALSAWVRLLKVHGLLLREVRRLVPDGLTLPQFDVLAQLDRRPEGMTPKDLTRELLVTAGNVTGIVERLAQHGLVRREPVPEDRRTVRIQLTPEGRRRIAEALPAHRRDLARLLAGVPPSALAALRESLGRFLEAYEKP